MMKLAERNNYKQEPSNPEERKRFMEFRKTDVTQMLVYCAIVHIFFGVGYTVMLMNDFSWETFIKFCSGCWFAMSYCIVSNLAKRFKSKLMTIVVVLTVLDHLALAIATELLVMKVGESQTKEMSSVVTDSTAIHIFFLSPSIYHTVFYFAMSALNMC